MPLAVSSDGKPRNPLASGHLYPEDNCTTEYNLESPALLTGFMNMAQLEPSTFVPTNFGGSVVVQVLKIKRHNSLSLFKLVVFGGFYLQYLMRRLLSLDIYSL